MHKLPTHTPTNNFGLLIIYVHKAKNQLKDKTSCLSLLCYQPWLIFFFTVLGFELRTSCLLGQHVIHGPTPFCDSYFSDRASRFCLGPDLDHNPPTYISHMAGIIVMSHHICMRRDPTNLLTSLASNLDPLNLHLWSRCDYRHKPLHPMGLLF
jgi:hypothetical protein